MCLERRDNILTKDFRMALLAMLDCIPHERWRIVNYLLWECTDHQISYKEAAQHLQMSVEYFAQLGEELYMMGVIEKFRVGKNMTIKLDAKSVIALENLSQGIV